MQNKARLSKWRQIQPGEEVAIILRTLRQRRAWLGRIADQDWVRHAVVAHCALCRGLWCIHPSHKPPLPAVRPDPSCTVRFLYLCCSLGRQCSPLGTFLHLHLLSKSLTVYSVHTSILFCVTTFNYGKMFIGSYKHTQFLKTVAVDWLPASFFSVFSLWKHFKVFLLRRPTDGSLEVLQCS